MAGVDVAIVERRASQELDGLRSGGLHSRTIEVLDQRGIADRFLAEGQAMRVVRFSGIPLDISDFPTRHNYVLALRQSHFERILAAWIGELGRGHGTRLLGHILDHLAAAGISVVEAKTLDRSSGYRPYEATLAFWERNGFIHIDTIDPLPDWPPGNPAAIYVAAVRPTR